MAALEVRCESHLPTSFIRTVTDLNEKLLVLSIAFLNFFRNSLLISPTVRLNQVSSLFRTWVLVGRGPRGGEESCEGYDLAENEGSRCCTINHTIITCVGLFENCVSSVMF